MANHLLNQLNQIEVTTQRTTKVRNMSGRTQIHGVYTLQPNEWSEVPYDLAVRLAGDPNYEVPEINSGQRKAERRTSRVLRHPAALSPSHLRSLTATSFADHALGRVWRGDVEQVEVKHLSAYRVSVIIPVYNSPKLLEQALASLKLTKFAGKWEIVLVDNGSTDAETKALVRQYKHVRIEQPKGFSSAVNAGVNAAFGADVYVLFNQDCIVTDPSWLTHIARWMILRPQCGVAGCKLLYPDGTLQHAGLDLPEGTCGVHRFLKGDPDMPEVNFYERVSGVTGAVYAIRAGVWKYLNGFSEDYKLGCEDTDFCLRAVRDANAEVWYVPSATLTHIDNGVRKTNPKDSQRISRWARESDVLFRRRWGSIVDAMAKRSVDFVLPANEATAGGCRVIWAMANELINRGFMCTVYTFEGKAPEDTDFPILFETKALAELFESDVLVATRFDTVAATKHIKARNKYYFVQQIETCMAKYCGATEDQVLDSYYDREYSIITIGEHLADELARLGRSAQVVDVGYYQALYPYYVSRDINKPRKVLMYGSPADYKGAQDAAKIAEAIRRKVGNVEVASFHKHAPAPQWADMHHRPQNTAEVADLYGTHDVYVYASRSDGFAMTPIEAMSCGTPVVLSDFKGKDQYAVDGENCLIAPYRDANAVAEAVSRILSDKALYARLVRGGLDTASRYEWKAIISQHEAALFGDYVTKGA